MKALTLTQPWATLVVRGYKRFETRGWSTNYVGPLAVHAAVCVSGEAKELWREMEQEGVIPRSLPLGAIVGLCQIVSCSPTEEVSRNLSALELALGDYTPGRWAFELAAPSELEKPVSVRGMLGLWDFRGDLAAMRVVIRK
jgi:hypothetical protein